MKRILSFILTFAMMLSVIGSVVINHETAYARMGMDINGNLVDNTNIYQPTDDPVYYYQPPVDENGNHDYFGYPVYGDPQDITDEEFFGKWDETKNTWILEPYFSYSLYPDMGLVEEAAKNEDYETAKIELQNYYRQFKSRTKAVYTTDKKAPVFLDALSRNIFAYSYISMNSISPFVLPAENWGQIELDVLLEMNEAKGSFTDFNLMFASADKFWTTGQIYSKDNEDDTLKPLLRMVVNGVVTERYPYKDTMVVAGAEKNTNYGSDEILEFQEHGTFDDIYESYGSYDENTKRAFLCFDISDINPTDTVTSAKVIFKGRSIINDETRQRFADEDGKPYSGAARDKLMWATWYKSAIWEENELVWSSKVIADKFFFSCNDMEAWDYITPVGTTAKGKVCDYHRYQQQGTLCNAYVVYGDEKYAYTPIRQNMALMNSIGVEPDIMNILDMSVFLSGMNNSIYNLLDSEHMTPERFTAHIKFSWLITNHIVEDLFGTGSNNSATYATSGAYKTVAFFPEFVTHDYWYKRILEENQRCLSGFTLEDGFCVEMSQSYISTLLGTFANPLDVYQNTGHPGPYSEELFQDIYNIVKCGVYTSGGPTWGGFNIGDSVDPSANKVGLYRTWYQYLFSNDEELLYIISGGTSGKMPENPTTHYPVALRTFMRSGWDGKRDLQMSFINNSDSRASHFHNDCLSVAMYAYGKYLLIDPGYGSDQTSDGGKVWTYNKSPVQHSLVTVNDTYDYLYDGVYAYTKLERDSTWEKDFETNKVYDFIEYVCDGYSTAQTMQRSVTFMKNQKFWIVSDYVVPNDPTVENLFAQHWHMYPGSNPTHDEKYTIKSNFSDINVMVVPLEHEEIDDVQYVDAYYAERQGQKLINKKAVITKSKTGAGRFTTLIIPVNINEKFEISSRVLANDNNIDDNLLNMVYFNITEKETDRSNYYYYYHINDASRKPEEGVKVGNFVTDATTLVVQLNDKKEYVSLFITDGSYVKDLSRNGEYLFKSKEETTVSFTKNGQFVDVISSLCDDVDDIAEMLIYMPTVKAGRLKGEDVKVDINNGLVRFVGEYGSTDIPSSGGSSGGGGGGGGAGGTKPVKPAEPKPEDEKPEGEKPVEPTPVEPVKPSFGDVKDTDWFFEYVEELHKNGIVSGDDSGKFNPNDNVTREQFLKMLVEAAEIEAEEGVNTFADVKADAWYKPYVLKAKSYGIVNGVSDIEFGIGSNITRQDMAVMITRTIEKLGITIEVKEVDAFADNHKVTDYATEAVEYMKSIGLIEGYNNEYRPHDNLTRAEAAKVISELLKLL